MEKIKEILEKIYDKSIYLLIAVIFIYVGFKLTDYYTKHLQKNKLLKLEPTVKSFIINIINIVIKSILFIIAASIVGIPTTTFFTILGSCGIAIGLALQGGLSNFAGGLMLIIFKPFKQGDYIEVLNNEGTVKNINIFYTCTQNECMSCNRCNLWSKLINIFYTTLVTYDNKIIEVPNGSLSNSSIINYTANEKRRVDLEFSTSYNDDIKKVKKIISEIIQKSDYVIDKENVIISLDKMGDSSLIYAVKVWVNTKDYWNAKWYFMENIKLAFDKNHIEIPYPQLDVHQK